MKLVRMTDDRFILDGGPDIVPAQLDAIRAYWQEWWAENPGEIPMVIVIGGAKHPLEYEDRREPDIESRLGKLETFMGEFQRFYDFVGDVDPSIVDAWHFGENVRVQREAREAEGG